MLKNCFSGERILLIENEGKFAPLDWFLHMLFLLLVVFPLIHEFKVPFNLFVLKKQGQDFEEDFEVKLFFQVLLPMGINAPILLIGGGDEELVEDKHVEVEQALVDVLRLELIVIF